MRQLSLFREATHALSDQEREGIDRLSTPTCPDTSSQWSDSCGPDGFSAKMFLHQMLQISRPHWTCLDTERLLLKRMPYCIQVNGGSGSSLSAVLRKSNDAESWTYLSNDAVRGLIRRAIKRKHSLYVLLRIRNDIVRRTILFGKTGESEYWIKSKEPNLRDCQTVGLMGYLKQRLQELQGMPVHPNNVLPFFKQ